MENIVNEYGTYTIESKAIKEITQIVCLKIDNIVPGKKVNDFVDVDDDFTITIHIRIATGQDVHKLCNHIQQEVNENLLLMAGIDCKHINIDIQGFISEKKAKN